MNKELLPMEEMYPLIAEMLEIKGEVTFTVSGWSMQPMVYHRRDTVTLVKAELPLKKYDLPFYLMDNGRFLLHRVIKVENKDGKNIYTCQGDNRWEPETDIEDRMIIGVVKSFNRNGKNYSVDSLGYWLYTRTWGLLHHFKWMYNFPKRTKEKILRDLRHYKITRKLRDRVDIEHKHSLSLTGDDEKGKKITAFKSHCDSFFDKGSLIGSGFKSPDFATDGQCHCLLEGFFSEISVGGKKMVIEYRAARGSDLKDFYRIYERFSKKEAADYGNPIANTEWITTEGAKQYYNKLRQEQFFWLAVAKGEIIGFCTGSVRKEEPKGVMVGKLINIYVDEYYRSMGIGEKLVNTFKAYCKEYDCTNIIVTFMERNERAEKFYARHGFGTHQRTYIYTEE